MGGELRDKVASGVAWSLGEKLGTILLQMVVSIVVARLLLPDAVRLMALMLSGAVLAQVFNMLGATTGNIVLFVIIALVGNALNLALNLLGCYVHDMRLQFLEFFGRFYKDGGKAFRPLRMQANHVEIIKEEHVQ